ncbi:hypothetical protein IWQ51_003847 [Labrenzia sp. EL_142]|nr:hypothetical protein [Labrenzia sp. EL_142]
MCARSSRARFARHLIVSAIATLFAAAAAVAEPRQITFSELPDPAKQRFEDPFRDMENKVLEQLRTAVRLETRLSAGDVAEQSRPRLEQKATAARDAVKAAGYDVERLLSLRWVVAEHRKAAVLETNPDLDGAEVSLTGYLIPAGANDNGTQLAYLVPKVGMCSHIPPPPPNQLVRLRLPETVHQKSLYVPIRATGVLSNEASESTIYILDGETRMMSRWTMRVTDVETVQSCNSTEMNENGLRKRANVCLVSSKRSFDLRTQRREPMNN